MRESGVQESEGGEKRENGERREERTDSFRQLTNEHFIPYPSGMNWPLGLQGVSRWADGSVGRLQ